MMIQNYNEYYQKYFPSQNPSNEIEPTVNEGPVENADFGIDDEDDLLKRNFRFPSFSTDEYIQGMSNMILLFAIWTGIFYGIFVLDSQSLYDSGGLLIFASLVGGVVSLMLVNVNWWYKRQNPETELCSFPQIASSLILIAACIALLPVFADDKATVLLGIFVILVPILAMVWLPSCFVMEPEDNDDITDDQDAELAD